MARCDNIQRPISIPEPTNKVDSLWRTTQALKEAVEVIQGVRGNREYALKCQLQELEDTVSNLDTSSGIGSEVNDLTAAVTWANIPDANVPQTAVTQHQAALSITESQISDLGSYLTAESNDLSAAVTWTNVPDANITESSILQHLVDATNSSLTIGTGAGAALTATGFFNTALGVNALNDGTTCDYNIAIGYEAMSKVTTVSNLTAIGYNALQNNTSGTYNTAIGKGALQTNTTGGYNTAIGIETLLDNNGSRNLALGAWALYDNTTGDDNVAIGYGACFKQGAAGLNTAMGSQALFNNLTGQYNCGIGYKALFNSTGDGNTAVGNGAGDNITSADRCITIGYFVDAPSATTDYQMSIGNLIYGTDVDGVATTLATGNVGISQSSPSAKLDVRQHETAGAKPVLKLEQVDVSEEIIEFACTIGTGNGIEAIGAKTLTTTHFIKVTLPGGLTRYIPCGTIA